MINYKKINMIANLIKSNKRMINNVKINKQKINSKKFKKKIDYHHKFHL